MLLLMGDGLEVLILRFKSIEDRNIVLNNINGILQVVSMNLVASFAGLFIKRLNASDNLVSMLNSLPALFSIIAIILATPLVTRFKNKKKVTSISYLLTRFFYLLMALTPFLPDKYRALFFVILYGALNLPGSIALFMWQSFLADLFDQSKLGRVLSTRNSLSTFVGTITILTAGLLLNKLSTSKDQLIHYYQIVFLIAFVVGLAEVLALTLHKENTNNKFKEVVTEGNKLSLAFLKNMIKQKKYVMFMVGVIAFHFAWQMGWPLFLIYEVDYLHTNEMWSALSSTVNGISTAIGYSFWRKFSEKHGNSLALTISAIGMASTPIFYTFATSMKQVVGFAAIIGFSVAGILLSLLNSLYEVSPQENRTSYIAFYNLATNLTLIIAPWIGMNLYKIIGIKSALIIVGILRFVSSFLFLIKPKESHLELGTVNN
jgi:MFS family permease